MPSKIHPKYFVLLAIVFVTTKYVYTLLTVDELTFLIAPVQLIVGLFTKTKGEFIVGYGYYFSYLNIVIERSCAGFNLWIISFICLSILVLKHRVKPYQKLTGFALAVIISYLLTLLANTSRILILINLKAFAKISWIHEGVGVFSNLTLLAVSYITLDIILTKNKTHEKLA